jgi:hypothetical protein
MFGNRIFLNLYFTWAEGTPVAGNYAMKFSWLLIPIRLYSYNFVAFVVIYLTY